MTARYETIAFSGRKFILIRSNYRQETESSLSYFTIKMKSFHLMKSEMALKRFNLLVILYTGKKKLYHVYRRLIIDRNDPLLLETSIVQDHAVRN